MQIKIGQDLIVNSSTLKYLGCTLDEHLKFSQHVKLMCAKASKGINLMKYIIKYIKPLSTLFYSSFIRPILECTPALLYCISKTDSDNIEKLQNRVLKIISGIKFNKRENVHLSDIRTDLQLPLLSSRREMFFFIKAFNGLNGFDTILKSLLLDIRVNTGKPSLRSNDPSFPKFEIPRTNKSLYGQRTFKYLVSRNWNNFPDELRCCKDHNKFKALAKQLFLDY